MVYIEEWQQMLFLACPIMKDLNNLIWTGLFVNDLRYVKIRVGQNEHPKCLNMNNAI